MNITELSFDPIIMDVHACVEAFFPYTVILPVWARRITRIKCIAIAEEGHIIYPVKFYLKSNDVQLYSSFIAVPWSDLIPNLVIADVPLDVPCMGGEQIHCSYYKFFELDCTSKAMAFLTVESK